MRRSSEGPLGFRVGNPLGDGCANTGLLKMNGGAKVYADAGMMEEKLPKEMRSQLRYFDLKMT